MANGKNGTKKKKFGLKRKTLKRIKSVGKTKIENMFTLFPPRKFITMDFGIQSALASSATQSDFGPAEVFTLNNISVPHATAVGAGSLRARGFDQLAAAYARYKVYGALVSVIFNNPTVDGFYACVRVQASSDDGLLGGQTINTSIAKKWTWIKPFNNTGSQQVHYQKYWKIDQVEGLTKSQFQNDLSNYIGSTGGGTTIIAGPQNVPYVSIAVANSAAAGATNVPYTLKIKYFLQLFDRVTIASSTYTP